MWAWLAENSASVQAATGIVTALVWIVYLQILVSGFRRERRSVILIHGAGNQNVDPRIFVSNLGAESIYILEILMTVDTGSGGCEVAVTDRTEVARDRLSSPSNASLQGPLGSGEWVDIGSVDELLQRMRAHGIRDIRHDEIKQIRLTVAATTAAKTGIVAARMAFSVRPSGEHLLLLPRKLHATQIRSFFGRRRIARKLSRRLQEARENG
ncbi:hypothetical protein [Paracoccus jeotgali]|uniref:Uncharacterized protein n=1 Tax=Paracoccus jeotgali TaxID=2065379 RepID=A0A2K9MI63_9RHOB|nr:hypothetical protein [Paracoccus jeotgali]AUM74716.1 hypothetical protein CYR75_10865 [Paracoccus jeotgali]